MKIQKIKQMLIYKVTNLINGKIYIGQTTWSIKSRWNSHRGKHSKCPYLSHAIQKYGQDNFTIEQIDQALTLDELNSKEEYWINFYDSMNPLKGYNIRQGGNNMKHSPESIEKMRISSTGKKHSEETKLQMSLTRKNPSEEIRRKMSASRTGLVQSEETKQKRKKAWLLNPQEKTRKLTEEQVREIRHLKENIQLSYRQISDKLDISYTTVYYVANRKTWKHI